jgi:tetratricopeptide (TPR) repeat protein
MEIANYWDIRKYNNFLNEFQRLMQHGISIWKKGIKQIKLAGDELAVFYCSKDVTDDIINSIALANTLKIMWYAGKPNRKRVNEGKKILDLGIGINTGYVTYENRPIIKDLKRLIRRGQTFEGLAISLAKRIESFSREGKYSRIMVGHQTIAELNKTYHWYEYEPMGLQRFKGFSQEVPVFELKSCYTVEAEIFGESKEFDWEIKQLERIRIFDPSNIWLLMTLIDIYGHKKNYKKVEKFCRESIAIEDSVSIIHNELGEALEEQKKYKEALEEYDKAINLRWDSWSSYNGKSVCLIFLGRYDECIKTCDYAISNMPPVLAKILGSGLYYNMAAAYARKGNKLKALTNIKKAIKLGEREIVKTLKKDRDRDFCNLYTNPEFQQIRKGNQKTKPTEKQKRKR